MPQQKQVKSDRISQVLKMLQEGQPRDKIADQFGYSTLGFSGHKEMATYMLRHGYIWSASSLNYINPNPAPTGVGLAVIEKNLHDTSEVQTEHLAMATANLSFDKYKTLLDFLWQYRDQLIKVIESMNMENEMRVYTIPGKAKTKSIFLSDGLSELMLTLCQKHSLSQRQGYEAALVEYLIKYGYQDNVEQLLNTREK